MAAPPAARRVLFPLYAFNLEVARAPWVTSEPMIAEIRLQWWRDALEEIAHGATVRRHEVVTPLADVLSAQGALLLDRLIQARRWDVYRDPFEDGAHFDDYIDATSGQLMLAAARALGVEGHEDALRDVGYALGVANWLIAVPELEARGRIPLVDGRAEAVQALATSALGRLRAARSAPKDARPVLLSAWRAGAVLKAAKADPARVGQGRLTGSEFARRGSLLWKSLVW